MNQFIVLLAVYILPLLLTLGWLSFRIDYDCCDEWVLFLLLKFSVCGLVYGVMVDGFVAVKYLDRPSRILPLLYAIAVPGAQAVIHSVWNVFHLWHLFIAALFAHVIVMLLFFVGLRCLKRDVPAVDFFRTALSIFVPLCQFGFSMVFGSRFDSLSTGEKIGACIGYPLAIGTFKAISVFLIGKTPLLYPVAAASLILAAVPYRVIFLALKDNGAFAAILCVELAYKCCMYPLRLSAVGQRLQQALLGFCTDTFSKSAQSTFSTPLNASHTDNVDGSGATKDPEADDRTVQLTTASDASPSDSSESVAIEVARRFFVHNMVDLTAVVTIAVLLQCIRSIDPDSAVGSIPDWDLIGYHYLIAIGFEVLLIASLSWGTTRYINKDFRPFVQGRDIVSRQVSVFFSAVLLAYALTFLIVDPRNTPVVS